MDDRLNLNGCLALLEGLIMDAFNKVNPATRFHPEEIKEIFEFSERRQNKLLEYYAQFYSVDEEKIRNRLKKLAIKKLNQ